MVLCPRTASLDLSFPICAVGWHLLWAPFFCPVFCLQSKPGRQCKGSERSLTWELLSQKVTELAEDRGKERKGGSRQHWTVPAHGPGPRLLSPYWNPAVAASASDFPAYLWGRDTIGDSWPVPSTSQGSLQRSGGSTSPQSWHHHFLTSSISLETALLCLHPCRW